MKIITMFSKREYLVADDEAENVAKASTIDGLLRLRNGEYINPKAIESIGEPAQVPFYNGYLVNKDGRTFNRDGERITIESVDKIKYLSDPKYQAMAEAMQIGSNTLSLPQ